MRNYHFTGPLRPVYPLSVKRLIPPHIVRPDYADHRELPNINGFQSHMVEGQLLVIVLGVS